MSETAKSMAARLMARTDTSAQPSYSKGEVKTILNQIAQAPDGQTLVVSADAADDAGCRGTVKAEHLQRGDAFIAKLVGGKVRPWVVLSVRGDIVSALAMSSGDHHSSAVQSQCRLWPGGFFGATMTTFSLEWACKEVTRPYTNLLHLAEVESQVAAMHGMIVAHQPRIISLADIRAKMST